MSTSNSSCVKISIKQFGEFCRTCLTKISPPAVPVSIYGTVIDGTPLTELLYKCVNVKATEKDRLPPNICTQCVFNLGQFNSFYRQCQKSQRTLQSVLNLDTIIKKNTSPLKFHTYSKPVDETVANKTSSKSKPVITTKRTLQKVTKPELAPIQFIHSYCKPPTDEKNVTNPPPLSNVKQEPGMNDTQIEEILIKTEDVNTNSNVPPLLILTPEMKKAVLQHKNLEESLKLSSVTNTIDIFRKETFDELVNFHFNIDNILEDQPVLQQNDPALEPIVTTPKKARKSLQTPRRIQEPSKQAKIIRKRTSRLLYIPLEGTDLNKQEEKSKDPIPEPADPTPDDPTDPTPDDPAHPTPDDPADPTPDDPKNPPDNPPPAEPKPPIKRQYQCGDCGRVFKGYHQYKIHTYSHTGGQMPHVCEHCGKDFLLNSLLKKHYYSHTNEKTVLCTYCSKFFKTPALLRVHIRTVHFKKPEDDLIDTKCPKCDKHFTSKNKYRMHQKVHSTRRHLCSECGKIFKAKGQFNHHMRIHTGETPFKCTFCGKGFRNNFGLKHHVYSHTGEKPYGCDVCEKSFRRPTHLRTHKKKHLNEDGSVSKCSFCGKIFVTVASWKKHMLTHEFQDEENSELKTVYC